MGDIAIGINPTTSQGLFASLGGYKEFLNTLTSDLLRQEAALSARAFIMFTAPIPYGGGSGDSLPAKKQGEIAVERDIRSLVAPRSATLASAVNDLYGSRSDFEEWKAKRLTKNSGRIINAIHADTNIERAYKMAQNVFGNSNTGGRILDDISELQELHNKQRMMYRGRITRNRGPSQDIKKNPYLVEAPLIKRYVELRQQAVGLLKSAWANVIQSIGKINLNGRMVRPAGGKLNQWITKHGNKGMGALRSDERNKRIKIINGIGDTMGVSSEADTIRSVIRLRSINLASNPYQKEVDKSVRLWNMNRIVFKK